jgi:hypothetical protein
MSWQATPSDRMNISAAYVLLMLHQPLEFESSYSCLPGNWRRCPEGVNGERHGVKTSVQYVDSERKKENDNFSGEVIMS